MPYRQTVLLRLNEIFLSVALLVFFQGNSQFAYGLESAREIVSSMTLEEKIGQVMFIGLPGQSLDEKDISVIKTIRPGGVVFYKRNFRDASGLKQLISRILPVSQVRGLPPLFAIDQEGGIVHRLQGESFRLPSAPALGSSGSGEMAYETGFYVGSELRDIGISINLAPVLDMPSDVLRSPMTMRSFGNDPDAVSRIGVSYIRGLKESGIVAVAKHFPGIGRAHEDTHESLPRISWKSPDERSSDLMPFREVVRESAEMIMVGHVMAEPGDKKNPVSLSRYWLKDVLRSEMGFKGLIIVDNIEMKAIEEFLRVPEASVESFRAGADIIMVSHSRQAQDAVFHALLQAVKKGTITERKLDESVERIVSLKLGLESGNGLSKSSLLNPSDISTAAADSYVAALSRQDAAFIPVLRESPVLFTGNNLTLYNAVTERFEKTSIINANLAIQEKLNQGVPMADYLKGFVAVIIDADYVDAPAIVSLCEKAGKNYIVVISSLKAIYSGITRLKPRHVILANEINASYYHRAMELITGDRCSSARLPFSLNPPPGYSYMPPL